MARQILFVQGAGEGAYDCWDSKLVASLERELGENYAVRYPRMPNEDDPSYAAWKPALTSELASLADGAILVAHSVGGTILLHVLAERQPKPTFGGLFVIAAPFVGEGGWPSDGRRLQGRLRRPPARPSHLSLSWRRRRRGTHCPCSSLCEGDSARRGSHTRPQGSPAQQRYERRCTRHTFSRLSCQHAVARAGSLFQQAERLAEQPCRSYFLARCALRLSVRTTDSHSVKRGSIPLGRTNHSIPDYQMAHW